MYNFFKSPFFFHPSNIIIKYIIFKKKAPLSMDVVTDELLDESWSAKALRADIPNSTDVDFEKVRSFVMSMLHQSTGRSSSSFEVNSDDFEREIEQDQSVFGKVVEQPPYNYGAVEVMVRLKCAEEGILIVPSLFTQVNNSSFELRVHCSRPFQLTPVNATDLDNERQHIYEDKLRKVNPLLPRTKVAYDRKIEEVREKLVDASRRIGATVSKTRTVLSGVLTRSNFKRTLLQIGFELTGALFLLLLFPFFFFHCS
jgi:hypothetical protein